MYGFFKETGGMSFNTQKIMVIISTANSDGMFSIYVFCAYVENISSELRYALLFLLTCGKHTK